MAFRVTCDVEACGAVIQEGPGQPTLSGKQATYCDRCAGYIAAVDAEVDKEAERRGWRLVDEINALRKEMLAKALPQQLGGTGLAAEWHVVVPEARP